MQVFKIRGLAKFARKERISDASLLEAVDRAEQGIVDADLGGGLIKQRVARPGQGRSGGYRMIIAYRTHNRAVFLFGFAKNEQENINHKQLLTLQELGAGLLNANAAKIEKAIEGGALWEINLGSKA